MKEIKALISSIEVIGIKSLKLGLLITISPGKCPNGSLLDHGQQSPAITKIAPIIIKNRCI